MNAIYLMLPVALLLGFGFLACFVWMTNSGQYDDLKTPAHRMLLQDEPAGLDAASKTTTLKP